LRAPPRRCPMRILKARSCVALTFCTSFIPCWATLSASSPAHAGGRECVRVSLSHSFSRIHVRNPHTHAPLPPPPRSRILHSLLGNSSLSQSLRPSLRSSLSDPAQPVGQRRQVHLGRLRRPPRLRRPSPRPPPSLRIRQVPPPPRPNGVHVCTPPPPPSAASTSGAGPAREYQVHGAGTEARPGRGSGMGGGGVTASKKRRVGRKAEGV
jgi:hypothetical protein